MKIKRIILGAIVVVLSFGFTACNAVTNDKGRQKFEVASEGEAVASTESDADEEIPADIPDIDVIVHEISEDGMSGRDIAYDFDNKEIIISVPDGVNMPSTWGDTVTSLQIGCLDPYHKNPDINFWPEDSRSIFKSYADDEIKVFDLFDKLSYSGDNHQRKITVENGRLVKVSYDNEKIDEEYTIEGSYEYDEAGRIIHAKSFGIKVDGYDESFNSYYDDGCLKYHIEFVEYGDNIDTSESRFYEYEQKGDTIIVKEYSLYSQDDLKRMADWPEPPEIEPEPVATVSCGGEVGFYKDKNPEHVYTYKMDGTKLLSVAVAHESVLETNPEYSYDQNGRLVKIESMWESYKFDYDEKGNIISIEFEGSSEEGDKIKSAVTYEYKNLRDLYIEYKNGKKTGTVEDSDRKIETDTGTDEENMTDTTTEETAEEIPVNKTASSDKNIYSDEATALLSRFCTFLKNPAGYSGNVDEMGYIGMWANKHQEDCTSGYKYMVEDLDNDGIDEVIISYGDSSKTVNPGPVLGETGLLIYTFKNGEAQIVTDFTPHSSTTVYKLENGNVVECVADGNYYFCWKIINIKESMEYSSNEEYIAEGETDNDLSYSYKDSSGNAKSMSKEEYESAISKIQKSIINWNEGKSFADYKE